MVDGNENSCINWNVHTDIQTEFRIIITTDVLIRLIVTFNNPSKESKPPAGDDQENAPQISPLD